MKKILFLLTILYTINSFSQEIKYKEYSYTEFFKLIEEEKDSVFTLKDAIIKINPETDKRFIITQEEFISLSSSNEKFKEFEVSKRINKTIELNNVQFQLFELTNDKTTVSIIQNIEFLKPVTLINVSDVLFRNIKFDQKVKIRYTSNYKSSNNYNEIRFDHISAFSNCLFGNILDVNNFRNNIQVQFGIMSSIIKSNGNTDNKNKFFPHNLRLNCSNFSSIEFSNNYVEDFGVSYFQINDINDFEFSNNTFTNSVILLIDNEKSTQIINNHFKQQLFINLAKDLNSEFTLDYKQFDKNLFSFNINTYFYSEHNKLDGDFIPDIERLSKRNIKYYLENALIKNEFVYKEEQKLKGRLYQMYRQNFDTDFANLVYTDIKDLETKRSGYLYKQNPSFKGFFTWKINQFLKVFSAYGTEPARAIVFSMYVILLFAFIYLLFPNSWDSLGKKRLMHRFEFFQKYLRRNEGIHTIYLEGKAQEISSYNDFKNKLDDAKLELPAFFISWSKPLYSASMFSSKLMTRFLKTTNVLTGKWKDLSPKQKRLKNIQIGFLLTIGLFYDILIKMLNALMLSINTFTTLGFGEIPIKGLPRYLAIIQGFIGWFMLTIFSVSLISQLLN